MTGEPIVVVDRVGRLTYRIYIKTGPFRYGPLCGDWFRIGRQRAIRKGNRELRRFIKAQRREREWAAQTVNITTEGVSI